MTNLQSYLQKYGTEDLTSKYSIKVKTHNKYPNLHLFKYDMINSPFSEQIVLESRGIILDKDNNWKIISYPYDKFFNHGEKYAATINWDNATVYNKLDGSLITLYWYNGWNVSTSGMPDGSGPVNISEGKNTLDSNKNTLDSKNQNKTPFTFSDLFWQVWKDLKYELPQDTTKCYIFEITTPYNQIIVPQTNSNITLHGIRCLKTLKEQPISDIYGWNVVKNIKFNTIDEAIKHGIKLDPSKQEGYVICDKEFNRIKVKSVLYIRLHHIGTKSDKTNRLDLIKVIQMNEGDEFMQAFPSLYIMYNKIKEQYDNWVTVIEMGIYKTKDIPLGKELAMKIKDEWYSGCIFDSKRKSYTNVTDFIKNWLASRKPQLLLEQLVSW